MAYSSRYRPLCPGLTLDLGEHLILVSAAFLDSLQSDLEAKPLAGGPPTICEIAEAIQHYACEVHEVRERWPVVECDRAPSSREEGEE